MELNQIYSYLCYYDKRNPFYNEVDSDDKPVKCFCDNCFYQRNLLALEILKLREKLISEK